MQYKLNDITVTGISAEGNDYVQIISATDFSTVHQYGYITAEAAEGQEEYIGWYDLDLGDLGDPSAKVGDDVLVNVGQAFLCNIGSGNEPSFHFSGEVPTASSAISTDGSQYPYFGNYIPRAIPLNWITVTGISAEGNDYIQVIDSRNFSTLHQYGYITPEAASGAEEYIGWYDLDVGDLGDPSAKVDDSVLVNPGDAFLGNIGSGSVLMINFPSSTKNL